MDFFSLVESRRSIRAFTAEAIRDDQLRKILEVANQAPSAGNLQAYEIQIVRDQARKRALVHAALDQDFLAQAPVVLAFFAHPARSAARYRHRGADLYALQDATIACAFAHLAAAALGLGSVWVGAFDDEAVSKALSATADWRPVALLPIGHPAESPGPRSRRPLEELVHPS